MKLIPGKLMATFGFVSLMAGLPVAPPALRAQAPWTAVPPMMAVPTTPDAQRVALSNLRSRVNWLQNATRTAPNYASGGADMVRAQFQYLKASYGTFTLTLNARQQAEGANEIAELSAGLDILQEAFSNYQDDVAAGRSVGSALNDLCQVLGRAAGVWLQQLNKDAARLRVGR